MCVNNSHSQPIKRRLVFIKQLNKQAYSLLELSFALFFAASVIGAVTFTYTNVAESNRTTTFMAQHNMLIAKLGAYFMEKSPRSFISGGTSSDDIRLDLYNRGIIPQVIGDKGTHMASGKLASIKTLIDITTNQQLWQVNYAQITKTSCYALLESGVGINQKNVARAQKIFQIDTNSKPKFYDHENQPVNGFSRQNIADACASPRNDISLTYIFG